MANFFILEQALVKVHIDFKLIRNIVIFLYFIETADPDIAKILYKFWRVENLQKFIQLLRELDYPNLKVNYDSGNSASLGYDIQNEFEAYGKYISIIHIKSYLYV